MFLFVRVQIAFHSWFFHSISVAFFVFDESLIYDPKLYYLLSRLKRLLNIILLLRKQKNKVKCVSTSNVRAPSFSVRIKWPITTYLSNLYPSGVTEEVRFLVNKNANYCQGNLVHFCGLQYSKFRIFCHLCGKFNLQNRS